MSLKMNESKRIYCLREFSLKSTISNQVWNPPGIDKNAGQANL